MINNVEALTSSVRVSPPRPRLTFSSCQHSAKPSATQRRQARRGPMPTQTGSSKASTYPSKPTTVPIKTSTAGSAPKIEGAPESATNTTTPAAESSDKVMLIGQVCPSPRSRLAVGHTLLQPTAGLGELWFGVGWWWRRSSRTELRAPPSTPAPGTPLTPLLREALRKTTAAKCTRPAPRANS